MSDGVDIIVPVHGAGVVFARCAASLARHVDPARHRIVIVLDGDADDTTTCAVEALQQAGQTVTVITHSVPAGFVASANEGMRVSDRDVVLLNSDTQVTRGWLDKMHAAAYANPMTATVSPFSNNATICSLPAFLEENTLPAGVDLDTFAATVERVSVRAYPHLPTGTGACLYVRRAVLEDIGLFDAAFAPGYGEEVDFCLRASRRGYHHVLDDATFIFHEGSRSFGTSRRRRVRRAHRLIRVRHRAYQRQVHDFIRRDPLASARARVIAALRSTEAPATRRRAGGPILHVVHGWPPWAHGGTELYAYWLAHEQAARSNAKAIAVHARFSDVDRQLGDAVEHWDRGVRVRLVVNNFTQRSPVCRNGFHCPSLTRDFAAYVDKIQPAVVHIHHLAGHCASLVSVAARRGIPILYQAQDWWPICARVNLINREHILCSGPGPLKCARCLPLTHLPPAPVASALLHDARRRWIRSRLASVSAVVMGSRFIADSYQRARVLPPHIPVHVVPYGVPMDDPAPDRPAYSATRPLRFGYVGALLPHKGVHVCVEAFTQLHGGQAELHVWGSSNDAAYQATLRSNAVGAAHIQFHGAFPEAEKTAILRSLDVLIVPSIGWESFGLVGREAMAQGVPVIASRLGALTEMFLDHHGGASVTPGDANDLRARVQQMIDTPALADRWRRSLPPVKSMRRHAEEIDELYQTLIQPRLR